MQSFFLKTFRIFQVKTDVQKKHLKVFKAIASLVFLFVIISGCGLGTSSVVVEELPNWRCPEEPVEIHVRTIDNRICQKGRFGLDAGDAFLKKELADLINTAVKEEFEKYNYRIVDEGLTVEIDIDQFYCDFTKRRFSWNCNAELVMQMRILGLDGVVAHSRRIKSITEADFERPLREDKAVLALESLLKETVDLIVNDKRTFKVLQKLSLENK